MPIAYDEKFDAFISYSSLDGMWVHNTLYPQLSHAGIKLCIDCFHFTIGIPILKNIELAIQKSEKVILVISEHWVNSEWCNLEGLIIIQTLDPSAKSGRILPVLLRHCEIPDRLKILACADCRDPDCWDTAIKALVSNIKNPAPSSVISLIENSKAIDEPRRTFIVKLDNVEFEDLSEEEVAFIEKLLRQKAKCHTLKIMSIHKGSVIFKIECTEDGRNRLHRLIQFDNLPNYFTSARITITDPDDPVPVYYQALTGLTNTNCHLQTIVGFENEYRIAVNLLKKQTIFLEDIEIFLTAKYIHDGSDYAHHCYYAQSNFKPPGYNYPTKIAIVRKMDLPDVLRDIVASANGLIITEERLVHLHENHVQYIINESIMMEDGDCEIPLRNAKKVKIVRKR